MALRIEYLSPFGPYAAAKNAGILVDDVLIEYDGRRDLLRESDLFDHANHNKKPGDKVTVKLLRNGQMLSKQLPIQQ
jgi:S1-C subfamily serine protease